VLFLATNEFWLLVARLGNLALPPAALATARTFHVFYFGGIIATIVRDNLSGVNKIILSSLDRDSNVPYKVLVTARIFKHQAGFAMPITGLPFPGRHPIFWMFMSEA
jgi:hypothetical protein